MSVMWTSNLPHGTRRLDTPTFILCCRTDGNLLTWSAQSSSMDTACAQRARVWNCQGGNPCSPAGKLVVWKLLQGVTSIPCGIKSILMHDVPAKLQLFSKETDGKRGNSSRGEAAHHCQSYRELHCSISASMVDQVEFSPGKLRSCTSNVGIEILVHSTFTREQGGD